jgi:hypothetical protein
MQMPRKKLASMKVLMQRQRNLPLGAAGADLVAI